jgi:broad specificity phosphatase PhoE
MAERVVLIRHGETEWSSERRHTGRSDIPLNADGRRLAAGLRRVLATITGIDDAVVYTSPLQRAQATCQLAGLRERAVVCDDLVEWDYGEAEGKRTDELRRLVPDWSVWTHRLEHGESVADVGVRADRVLALLAAEERLVVLFAHAHILRILAARWCGLPPVGGRIFTLDPASVSILGHEREVSVIERWNLVAVEDLERFIGTAGPAATISAMGADSSRNS